MNPMGLMILYCVANSLQFQFYNCNLEIDDILISGIIRYTKEHRNLDIISDVRFSHANEVFNGAATKNKVMGKGVTKPKNPIHPDDLDKMILYFNNNYI